MDPILHICSNSEWRAALGKSEYRAESLESAGFIHCSRPEQVLHVANELFAPANDIFAPANDIFAPANDLVLLWIDPQKVIPEIRWEAADGQVFPHIYGPLNTDAVIAALPFPPDGDGVFRSLPGQLARNDE